MTRTFLWLAPGYDQGFILLDGAEPAHREFMFQRGAGGAFIDSAQAGDFIQSGKSDAILLRLGKDWSER